MSSASVQATTGLLLLAASFTKEEDIVEQISTKLSKYQESKMLNKPREQQLSYLKEIIIFGMMLSSKISTEEQGVDAFAQMEEIEQMQKAKDFFNPNRS